MGYTPFALQQLGFDKTNDPAELATLDARYKKLANNLVIKVTKSGVETGYANPVANTDVARGTTLLSAIATAVAGDTFYLSAQTFDLDTNIINLGVSGGAISLKGSGKYRTIIKSGATFYGNGIIITAVSNSEVSDLSIIATTTNGTGACWGKQESTYSLVDAVVNNVYMLGDADGIYFTQLSGGGVSNVEMHNVTVKTRWDVVYLQPFAGEFNFYDCDFTSIGGHTGASGSTSTMIGWTGTINLYNCTQTASGGASENYNVIVADTGGIVNIYGGSLTVSGTSPLCLYNMDPVSTIGVTANTIYNPTLTSGTITYLDSSQILTSLKTVDGTTSGLDADLLDGQHGAYYATASALSGYLPITGGTLTGNLLFTDNTYDIGASGANRPHDLFLSNKLYFSDTTTWVTEGAGSSVQLGNSNGTCDLGPQNGSWCHMYTSIAGGFYWNKSHTVVGDLTFTTGTNRVISVQNATSGAGNSLTISTGNGFAGVGGAFSFLSGNGSSTNNGNGSNGGTFTMSAGNGGATTGGGFISGGVGGSLTLNGGAGGAATGGTVYTGGGQGGNVTLKGGAGATGTTAAGPGGAVSFEGGVAVSGVSAGLNGSSSGSVACLTYPGGDGGAGKTGGNSGPIGFTIGGGGSAVTASASTNTGGGSGNMFTGCLSITLGSGGSATNTGGGAAVGGAAGRGTIVLGSGGNANCTGNTATGGAAADFIFSGGTGGSTSNGTVSTAGAGSKISFSAGAGGNAATGTTCVAGVAGILEFLAGNAGSVKAGGTGKDGGKITFTAGNGTNVAGITNNGGSIYFLPGAKSPSGVDGSIYLGSNGTTTRGSVYVGAATTQPIGFYGVAPTAQQTRAAYTTDNESAAYTGIDNLQVGTVYAQLADLNALRVAYETLRASYDDLRTLLANTGIVA